MCWECNGGDWYVQDTQEAMDYFKKLRESEISEKERDSLYHDYQKKVAERCKIARREKLIEDADIGKHLEEPGRKQTSRLPPSKRP